MFSKVWATTHYWEQQNNNNNRPVPLKVCNWRLVLVCMIGHWKWDWYYNTAATWMVLEVTASLPGPYKRLQDVPRYICISLGLCGTATLLEPYPSPASALPCNNLEQSQNLSRTLGTAGLHKTQPSSHVPFLLILILIVPLQVYMSAQSYAQLLRSMVHWV